MSETKVKLGLAVAIPFEGEPQLHIYAGSDEDEARVIDWVFHSTDVRQVFGELAVGFGIERFSREAPLVTSTTGDS